LSSLTADAKSGSDDDDDKSGSDSDDDDKSGDDKSGDDKGGEVEEKAAAPVRPAGAGQKLVSLSKNVRACHHDIYALRISVLQGSRQIGHRSAFA